MAQKYAVYGDDEQAKLDELLKKEDKIQELVDSASRKLLQERIKESKKKKNIADTTKKQIVVEGVVKDLRKTENDLQNMDESTEDVYIPEDLPDVEPDITPSVTIPDDSEINLSEVSKQNNDSTTRIKEASDSYYISNFSDSNNSIFKDKDRSETSTSNTFNSNISDNSNSNNNSSISNVSKSRSDIRKERKEKKLQEKAEKISKKKEKKIKEKIIKEKKVITTETRKKKSKSILIIIFIIFLLVILLLLGLTHKEIFSNITWPNVPTPGNSQTVSEVKKEKASSLLYKGAEINNSIYSYYELIKKDIDLKNGTDISREYSSKILSEKQVLMGMKSSYEEISGGREYYQSLIDRYDNLYKLANGLAFTANAKDTLNAYIATDQELLSWSRVALINMLNFNQIPWVEENNEIRWGNSVAQTTQGN